MIEWLSRWIGSDVPDEHQKGLPIYIERRNMKRSVVCAINEQCINAYCNDKECDCSPPYKPDCRCFTEVNERVPLRISEMHLMAHRLDYASNLQNKNQNESLRMRTTRLYWMQSQDFVIQRNAQLLKMETEDWGRKADRALTKLANLLDFNVVAHDPIVSPGANVFVDSDDENSSLAVNFDSVRIGQMNQTQPYNPIEASIEGEIRKFLKQHHEHYIECKSFFEKIISAKIIMRIMIF